MSNKSQEYCPIIGGEFVKTGDIREIRNPYDSSLVGRVHFAGPDMMDKVVEKAVEGYQAMRSLPVYEKARILEEMARGVRENLEEIAGIIAREAGKPIKFARGEATRCALTLQTSAEEAKRINGEVMALDWAESAKGRTGFTRRFPMGPILGISPFNFPLNLAAHKVGPALAAGNSIIIKPSSSDPISALWLGNLARKAGAPAGALQVIPASPASLEPLVNSHEIKMISFTGSPRVGWALKDRSRRKKVALELGGNGGVVIDRDCDTDYAVSRVLMGGFAYAGQVCISVQRVIIHRDIYSQFRDLLLCELPRQVKLSDPLDPAGTLSAMIREEEARRVESWIKEALDAGGVLLAGGDRNGSCMSPTIMEKVPRDAKIYREEAFGPVIVLEQADSLDDGIDRINDSRFGLQSGVFTRDLEGALKAFDTIEAGGVMINDVPTFRIDPMPYGGVKESGFGREGVRYSIEEMTELKLMVINRQ